METKTEVSEPPSRLQAFFQRRTDGELPSHLQELSESTRHQASGNEFTSFLQNEYSIFALEPGEGCSAIEMYVKVAVDALNSIEHVDPTASKAIRQVIDYLVNCTQANPRGLEDALANIEDLTIKNDELEREVCDLQYHEEFLKAENDGLKDRLVVVEDMMTKYQMDNEKKECELREVKKRMVELDEFLQQERNNTLHNKTIRNSAVMRQNELSAQLMEEMSNIERLKIKMKNIEFKNKELNEEVLDQTILIDQLREQVNEEQIARKQLEAKRKEQLGDLEVENVKYKNRVDVLSEQLDKKDNNISNLQQEIKTLNFNLQQLKSTLRNENRIDNVSKTFDTSPSYQTGKKQREQISNGEEVEVRNAGVQVNALRQKINPNFKYRLIDPEDEDPEVLAAMHIEDLSEDSDHDLCDEIEDFEREYDEKHHSGMKSKQQKSLALLEELEGDPPDFEQIVDPRETARLQTFLEQNCCTRQEMQRHIVMERLLMEKYRKYKFEYTMQAMELEYLQREVKCDEIQSIILNLDQVLEKSLENANGMITEGSEFERTLQYLEDMKKELFTKLQQADEEDLKYMLLLTQARKLTTQIEENLAKPKLDNLSAITGVNSTVIPSTPSPNVPLTDDFLHTIVKQITNVLGRAKRAPKKREQYVNFDDFCKEIQPDLIVRKQQHGIQSVVPKFNITQEVLGARANASKAVVSNATEKASFEYVEKPVIQIQEKIVEKIVEKVVEKVIEKPVFVDKPVYIEKIVEKPILQYVDRVVERVMYKSAPDSPHSTEEEEPPVVTETAEKSTETDPPKTSEKAVDHTIIEQTTASELPSAPVESFEKCDAQTEATPECSSISVQTAFIEQQYTVHHVPTFDKGVEKESLAVVESVNLESIAVQTEEVIEILQPPVRAAASIDLESSSDTSSEKELEFSHEESESVSIEPALEQPVSVRSIAVQAEFKQKTRTVGILVQIETPCLKCTQYERELAQMRVQAKQAENLGEIRPEVIQYQEWPLSQSDQQGPIAPPAAEEQNRQIFLKMEANTDEFVDTIAHNFKGKDGAVVQGATKLMISKFIQDESKQAVSEILTLEGRTRNYLEAQLQRAQLDLAQVQNNRETVEDGGKTTTMERVASHIFGSKEQLAVSTRQLPVYQVQEHAQSEALIENASDGDDGEKQETSAAFVISEAQSPLYQRNNTANDQPEPHTDSREDAMSVLKRAKIYKSLRMFEKESRTQKCQRPEDFISVLEEEEHFETEEERDKAHAANKIVRQALAAYTQKSEANGVISAEQTITFAGAAATISLRFLRAAQDHENERAVHEDCLRYNGQLIRLPHMETGEYELRGEHFVSPYASAIRFRRRYLQALKANNATVFRYLQSQQRAAEASTAVSTQNDAALAAMPKNDTENQCRAQALKKAQIDISMYAQQDERFAAFITERLRIADVTLLASRHTEQSRFKQITEGCSISWLLIQPWMVQFANLLQEIKCRPRVQMKTRHSSSSALLPAHGSVPSVSSQISELCYAQMPENTQIKPIQWLIRFVRQVYYELDHEQIYALRRRFTALSFAHLLFQYILQKVGIQEQALLLSYTLLCTLEFHLMQNVQVYAAEMQLFTAFLAGDMGIEQLLFAKYCRSLFPLDDNNPAVLPLQQAVAPHHYSKNQISQTLAGIFKIDAFAAAQFAEKRYDNADAAILHAVLYNYKNDCRITEHLAKIFDSHQENGRMSLEKCMPILLQISPELTHDRLEELLDGRELTEQLFIQIYKQLLGAPEDTLRREVWLQIQNLDRVVLANEIVDDQIEELREGCMFWFESGKMLRAKAFSSQYERYVVSKLTAKEVHSGPRE